MCIFIIVFQSFKLFYISWTLSHHEYFPVVGPNGIGKSTILKLISGELQPTSGTVFRSAKVSFICQRLQRFCEFFFFLKSLPTSTSSVVNIIYSPTSLSVPYCLINLCFSRILAFSHYNSCHLVRVYRLIILYEQMLVVIF